MLPVLASTMSITAKDADHVSKPIDSYYTFEGTLAKNGCKKLEPVIETTSTPYDASELLKHAFSGSVIETAKLINFLNSSDPFQPSPVHSKDKSQSHAILRATSVDIKKYIGARFCVSLPADGSLPSGFCHVARTNADVNVRQIATYSFGKVENGYTVEGVELVRNNDGKAALNPDEPNMDRRIGIGDTSFLAFRHTAVLDGKVQYPGEIQFIVGSYTTAIDPRDGDESAVLQMGQESVIVQIKGEYDPAKKNTKFSLVRVALGNSENLASSLTDVVPHHASQERRVMGYLNTTGKDGLVEQGLLSRYNVAWSKLPTDLQETVRAFQPFKGRSGPGSNSDLFGRGFIIPVELPAVFDIGENGEFRTLNKKDFTKTGGADLSFKLELDATGKVSIYGVRLSKPGKEPTKPLASFSAQELIQSGSLEATTVLYSQVSAFGQLKLGAKPKEIQDTRTKAFASLLVADEKLRADAASQEK